MMSRPARTRRFLIRLSHLLPLISGLLILFWAAIPHVWFLYGNAAYETQSTFTLVANTFSDCYNLLSGTLDGSSAAMLFAYAMTAFVLLFWVGVITYVLTSVPMAVCSCVAFSYPPTAKEANRAKRWFRFFCPNRVLFAISNLAILVSAAFPHILLSLYRTQLGYGDMSVHFFGPSDLLLAVLLVTCNLSLYFALLSAQDAEHMDLYRLYKAKKE